MYQHVLTHIKEDPGPRRASLTADIGPYLLVAQKVWQPEKFLSCHLIHLSDKEDRIEVTPEFLEELMDEHMTFKIGWPEFLNEYQEQYDTPCYQVTLDTIDPEDPKLQEFLKAHEIEMVGMIKIKGLEWPSITYQGTKADLIHMIGKLWDDSYLQKFIKLAPGH